MGFDFRSSLRDAAALLNQRRFAEADEILTRAATAAPDDPAVIAFRGVAFYGMGQLVRGAEHFDKALALAPERRDLAALWESIRTQPYLTGHWGIQGIHAPDRQVFMSAALDLARRPGQPLTILEVGSYMGCSLLTWANAAEKLHDAPCSVLCVDTWSVYDQQQYPEAVNDVLRSNQVFEVFLHNAEVARSRAQVHFLRGASAEVLPPLRDHSFDLVYVDGCHYYDEVLNDLVNGKRLVRDGGIICGDDLELQAADCDLPFARAHPRDDFVQDPHTTRQFHPGVTVAVHEAFGRVSCFNGFWAMRKVGPQFAPVSLCGARATLPMHWPADIVAQLKDRFQGSNEIARLV